MSTMFIRNILKRFQPLRSGRFICHSCELCSPTYNQCHSTAYYSRSHETSENLESPPTSDSTVSWDTIRRQDKSDFLSKKLGVLDLDEVHQFLNEEGSLDIVVIEVPKKMCYVDHFIICTATSARHVASIAEMANKLYKSKRRGKQPFTLIEGKRISDDWQCIDMGNMVIHIMLEDTREKYNLEKLWTLGHKYDDLMNEKPSDEEIMKRLSMDGLNLMSMNEDTVKALGNLEDLNPWDNPPEDFFDMSSKSDKNESNVDDTLEDDDAFLV